MMQQNNKWQNLTAILDLFNKPFLDLVFEASLVHRSNFKANEIQVSTLCSVKTGGCPENCKYCPQSAHYQTGLQKDPFMDVAEIVESAKKAKQQGSDRFCMGAAWRSLHDRDLPKVCQIIKEIKDLGLETCMTLGMVTQNQAQAMKDAGLDFYNHNIDSSREFYETIISTRSYDERLETLKNVADSGLKVCCGGIVGMGESVEDRAKMLLTLTHLPKEPESIPINMLVQAKGTPLENQKDIDPIDFIRMIAVTRIIFNKSWIRLSAGRLKLSTEAQAMCFLAGANSIFFGEKLLTTQNNEQSEDLMMIAKLGLVPVQKAQDANTLQAN
jgi:biotin synthase